MTSLRILYIHQYFRTPEQGSSSRSWYFTRALAEAGHKPVVITAHNEPVYQEHTLKGVEVHYLPVPYDNAFGFLRRIRAFLRFSYKAIRLAGRLPAADLAYILSTPLTTGIIGLYLKRYRDIPYLFDVADLWPRAPVEIGAIRHPFLINQLYWLEKKIYCKAEKVVALSPAIQDDILMRMPDLDVEMIPNMADLDFFGGDSSLKNEDGPFIITYFGTAGVANHLEFLLDAAEATRDILPEVSYYIVAEGARLEAIKNESKRRGLTTVVKFVDYMPKKQLRKFLDRADAVYISFKDLPVLETGSPNKFFDGLAAGKMIITNFRGWIADLVRNENIGFSYSPRHPNEFVEKLGPYVADRSLAAKSGAKAAGLAGRSFSRKEHSGRFVKLIEETGYRTGR
ncbi:MAG: glycosyltransferase family 4 protein [Cyclobacteriaceae bacterium]